MNLLTNQVKGPDRTSIEKTLLVITSLVRIINSNSFFQIITFYLVNYPKNWNLWSVAMEGELHSLEDTNILSWSGSSRPPPISPDELVIRSRGKRRVPAKFSPEREEAAAVPKSPAKPVTVYLNPGQMMMRKFSSEFYRSQLIGAPRKNLFPSVQNVQKKDETRDDSTIDTSEVTPAKKLKTTELKLNVNNNEDNLDDSLKLIKVLSRDQMTNILTELAKHDVTTQQKLTEMLPSEPDITPQLKNLAYHGINVYKALPRSRLTNHHDSFR